MAFALCGYLTSSFAYAAAPLTYEQVCGLSDGKYPYSLTIPWRNKDSTESIQGIIKHSKQIYALEERTMIQVSCLNYGANRIPLGEGAMELIEVLNKHIVIKSPYGWSIVDPTEQSVRTISLRTIEADHRVQKYKRQYHPSLRITRVTKDGVYVQVTRTKGSQYRYGQKSFFFSNQSIK